MDVEVCERLKEVRIAPGKALPFGHVDGDVETLNIPGYLLIRELDAVVVRISEVQSTDSLLENDSFPIHLKSTRRSHEGRVTSRDTITQDHNSKLGWEFVEQWSKPGHHVDVHTGLLNGA